MLIVKDDQNQLWIRTWHSDFQSCTLLIHDICHCHLPNVTPAPKRVMSNAKGQCSLCRTDYPLSGTEYFSCGTEYSPCGQSVTHVRQSIPHVGQIITPVRHSISHM